MDFTLFSSDGTMANNNPLKLVCDHAIGSFRELGMDLTASPKFGSYLKKAGFVQIHHVIKKVPVGPWARGSRLEHIGVLQEASLRSFISALERPFQLTGMTAETIREVINGARETLESCSVHAYFEYHFWCARKLE